MNTIKIKVLTVVFACAAALLFAAQNTAAQFVPPGSYQKSCNSVKLDGANLLASCLEKTKDGGFGAGDTFAKVFENTLERVYECEGDIWNDNGKLKCSRNPNSARLKQAKSLIVKTATSVIGGKHTEEQHQYWLDVMFRNGLAPKYFAGLTWNDTLAFFKKFLATIADGKFRENVINAAFTDVYGWGVSPKDLARWNAEIKKGETVYVNIVEAERSRLNTDKVIRRTMITAAYKKTMGRTPTPDDYKYWEPRKETFKEIVEAARAYLYSPNGAKDLAETVTRALEAKTGGKPSIKQINDAITKFSAKMAVYDEM